MRDIAKRLKALEQGRRALGAQHLTFVWSSQDQAEARGRYERMLAEGGRDPIEPGDQVSFLVWQDSDGTCTDDWSSFRSASHSDAGTVE